MMRSNIWWSVTSLHWNVSHRAHFFLPTSLSESEITHRKRPVRWQNSTQEATTTDALFCCSRIVVLVSVYLYPSCFLSFLFITFFCRLRTGFFLFLHSFTACNTTDRGGGSVFHIPADLYDSLLCVPKVVFLVGELKSYWFLQTVCHTRNRRPQSYLKGIYCLEECLGVSDLRWWYSVRTELCNS